MIDPEVLKRLLDHKKIAVLKSLYFAKEDLYLREIAKKSKVPVSSVFRILGELSKIGLVRVKEIGMMKFFGLIRDGRERFLEDWFKEDDLLDTFIEMIKGTTGLKKIVLHGKIENNHASIIIIGENLDNKKVDEVCEKIKGKGLDLSNVILNESQFEKLDKMGLYGGERKILL